MSPEILGAFLHPHIFDKVSIFDNYHYMIDKIPTNPVLNRIVIGDVGSGKTIVAFIIALAYLHGINLGQVALLAPTEVLAYQHFVSLLDLVDKLEKAGIVDNPTCIFSTSKEYRINDEKLTKAKFAKALDERVAAKTKLFWIGTHSLLYKSQLTADLVLIDEQHRFGVEQRKKLSATKDDFEEMYAHFISFTATPIPRTLALTFFDSLKPHFLETLASRKAIKTSRENQEDFESKIIPKIRNEIDAGHKVYIICTKVLDPEDDQENETWSIKKTAEIMEKYFPNQVLTVHGKDSEKKSILQNFKESTDKNILVATTVIEVGVDVSQATMAVIINAERYGLAALHQIRGRVGRNDLENNYCILVTPEKYRFIKRLQYLQDSNDGFVLAEKDLEIRGSGDIIGKSQSGFESEIEEMIGLDPEGYQNLKKVVDELDFDTLSTTLPRLHTYIERESNKVWEE
jgi:ATP-dependent DNA helicase RecG